ncbi:hypothetical protein AB833_17965 [Chromatiales bacterium (ex Bugula neritina AB1)]|nr:hypothetical protein AB833_17965 [Chromatiales bacterium (ex Bugula neritina AB1)]
MDKPLFSFGIITDTHIRAPQGDLSSPYPVNERANARARYAAALLQAQKPEFVIHLGDMVHPLPGMPVYNVACDEALSIFSKLPKLHFVAGNHDIGDKPMPGSPAAGIDNTAMSLYTGKFGPQWYSFEHKNCCIVVINSSLINTGIEAEHQQFQWLQQELEANSQKRIILFSHYPPYLHDTKEQEHYDNIAEPGRHSLLKLVSQYNIELVFSGHVHQFFFNQLGGTTFYTLPPTSFTRQDYAEIFNTMPATEFGRDDHGKYSVAIVEVYASGHRLRLLPTEGKEISQDQKPLPESLYRKRPTTKKLAVSLRHIWHQSIDLPYNGPMEEFSRKRVRNDYTLLRLLQTGIDQVRVPIHDLLEDSSRQRMADYASLGIRFHTFCRIEQLPQALEAACRHNTLVSTLECIMPTDMQEWPALIAKHFSQITADKLPIHLGYACSGAHASTSDKPFAHTVTSGFQWHDHENVLEQLATYSPLSQCSGIVFQIPWEASLLDTLQHMQRVFTSLPCYCVVNLRLSLENPAAANFDDDAIAERITSALKFVETAPDLRLHLDTFADIDRGYSPRHGLLDRRYNLRPAGQRLASS